MPLETIGSITPIVDGFGQDLNILSMGMILNLTSIHLPWVDGFTFTQQTDFMTTNPTVVHIWINLITCLINF